MKFKDLKVGDHFYLKGYEYIKTSGKKYSDRIPPIQRAANAIDVERKRQCAFGQDYDVNAVE